MRIDQLTVLLRARSQWEAMELGMALVRRHAGPIWKAWLLVTLPVLVLLNLLGWASGQFWLAGVLMWWLKPVFERIPLFVISRGVFGAAPGAGETVRAQLRWGWRGLGAYLGWRRLSPARSLLMPVDLLEGNAGNAGARRRVLAGPAYGHASLLTLVCANFELALQAACVVAIFMFVPVEMLSESLRAAWALIGTQTPAWARVGSNVVMWLAMTMVGPFYVGAGFGLYLNRRTQIEAWDVELAFRRLRQRLLASVAPLMLVLALVLPVPGLHAQDHATAPAPEASTQNPAKPPPLPPLLRDAAVDTRGFEQAVQRAYEDELLGGERTVMNWKRKDLDQTQSTSPRMDELFRRIAAIGAWLAEWGLWILAAALVLALLLSMRWWLPWLRGGARRARVADTQVRHEELLLPDALPADVLAGARRLWDEGRPRHALALLYRASVEMVCERSGQVLPPGATEAQCLPLARQLPEAGERELFARVVKVWQYAAYAGRLPGAGDFDQLLLQLQPHLRRTP